MNRDLAHEVVARLGCGPVAPDLAGLRRLLAAWHARMPFDNLRKLLALRDNAPLPGLQADDFFRGWLDDGAGATCWATNGAFAALLDDLGFAVERLAGQMHERGILNHGSVAVRLAGGRWLADPTLLPGRPLPMDGRAHAAETALDRARLEPAGEDDFRVWFRPLQHAHALPCRILGAPVTAGDFVVHHLASRATGPFNDRPYARAERARERLLLVDRTLHTLDASGGSVSVLNPAALAAVLVERFGLSRGLVERARRAGIFAPAQAPASLAS